MRFVGAGKFVSASRIEELFQLIDPFGWSPRPVVFKVSARPLAGLPAQRRTYNRKIHSTRRWSQPFDVRTYPRQTRFLFRRIIEHTSQHRTAEPSWLDPKPKSQTPFGWSPFGWSRVVGIS